MNSDAEKIFGYILICIGLICIIFAFFSVYEIFTDKAEPPEIFKMKSFNFTISSCGEILPSKVSISLNAEIRNIVNIFLYYLFMLFILAVGTKVSSLGIQFIKRLKASQEDK